MGKIHWIGTGLSSIPGLRHLLNKNSELYVWNRTLDKAVQLVGDLTDNIYQFNLESLQSELLKDDIVVSMLPGEWHVPIAKLCLNHSAHFVSSSYISEEMRLLNSKALEKNLTFINEVGIFCIKS